MCLCLFQATNGAGLTSQIVSRAVIIDTSPPIAGHVYDVTADNPTTDVDFQVTPNKYLQSA